MMEIYFLILIQLFFVIYLINYNYLTAKVFHLHSILRLFDLLKKLHLQYLLSASTNKNIFTMNVNGQMITTQTSNLQLQDTFIDFHPKVFRRFVKVKRQNNSFTFIS